MKRPTRALLAALLLVVLCLVAATVPATAAPPVVKQPVATGTGGAIATVDLDASAAGLEVLRHGGNAVDAAVAAAATLGVTEAYSAGIGGGGFMVVYLAGQRRVVTIDGRETAPAAFAEDSFIDPATGAPIPFAERVTSGLGVGVPGTVATWQRALRKYGTKPLGKLLRPAIRVAERGFVVDQTFADQTASNAARFAAFPATAELFLPGGAPPAVGSVLRNPDLARTYRLLARAGTHPFYRGRIAEAIADTVQDPPVDPASTLNVRPGLMTTADLAAQLGDDVGRQHVRAHRQELPELDERRAELVEHFPQVLATLRRRALDERGAAPAGQKVGQTVPFEEVAEAVPDGDLGDLRQASEVACAVGRLGHDLQCSTRKG